jgi:hypothetical protein
LKAVILSAISVCLLICAPTIQAFKETKTSFKDGYDAGYFTAKAGKPYDFNSTHTERYKTGYDFGYRDGSSGSPYDPIKKYANKDSEQEDGIAYDAQGNPCIFGPSHDDCYDKVLEGIPGTRNYIDYHSGYKIGHADGLAGVERNVTSNNAPSWSWYDGYIAGLNDGHNLPIQTVWANKADSEKEAGIASDSNCIPCIFGPNHDECNDTGLQGRSCNGIVGSPNYDDCVYAQGFKTGYDYAIKGHYDKNTYDPDTTLAEGYFAGW